MRPLGARRSRAGGARWLGVAVVALLAVQAVRGAVVEEFAESRPKLAHAVWPSHPAPAAALALADIGAAARAGKGPPAEALARIDAVGAHAPLASEPLTVAATGRLAAGDRSGGERLLEAALARDPFAPAPHFLMADLLIRQQRLGEALTHVGFLSRRLGGAATGFADALVTYLREPGALARVAPVLGRDPMLREVVMGKLALDPAPSATASLAAMLTPADRTKTWLASAMNVRLAAGDVAAARLLLARSGTRGGGQSLSGWGTGAGPIGWTLASGADATAEADPGTPLRIVYFGRGDVPVAEHPLLLAPGRYRLSWVFSAAPPAGTFEWRMACRGRNLPLAQAPVSAATGAIELGVPADCPTQRLALFGLVGDYQRTVSAELRAATLARVGGAP